MIKLKKNKKYNRQRKNPELTQAHSTTRYP
jgi:hypothetical protein